MTRRGFLAGSVAGAAALGDLAFLGALPAVSAEEAKDVRKIVELAPDIEPLVKLIEDTDRNKLLEVVAEKIHKGTSYGQLLAALLLAGVRGIQPRPVGFKFHAVLVVNSAHLAALDADDRERWLPVFWALDNFKTSQARNKTEGDWRMAPVQEAKLPPAHQAKQRFVEAMEAWDEEGADVAIASLVRSAGANDVMEPIWRLCCRDFRSIGHKIIYAANGYRTLQTIGWRHAEPVLRSLAYAMLANDGSNPAKGNEEADIPGRENLERVKQIRKDWQRGTISSEATTDLLATLRTGTPAECSEAVVKLLNKGIDPASIWDGLFLGAGELLMRQPGIVGLHCVTTANAAYFVHQNAADDETRRYAMLQTAAFLPMFLKAMRGRGKVGDGRIDKLEKAELPKEGALAEVFRNVSKDRQLAASQTLSYLAQGQSASPEELIKIARRLIFTKGRDSHDYKFSSAALEDCYHVTPAWRDRFLATSMFNLKGSEERDNTLIDRTRAALQKG
jgi:hypothetical protein